MSPNDAAPAANPVAYAEYETRLTEHLRKYYGESLGLDERRVRLSIARRLARERGRELARILDDLLSSLWLRLLPCRLRRPDRTPGLLALRGCGPTAGLRCSDHDRGQHLCPSLRPR